MEDFMKIKSKHSSGSLLTVWSLTIITLITTSGCQYLSSSNIFDRQNNQNQKPTTQESSNITENTGGTQSPVVSNEVIAQLIRVKNPQPVNQLLLNGQSIHFANITLNQPAPKGGLVIQLEHNFSKIMNDKNFMIFDPENNIITDRVYIPEGQQQIELVFMAKIKSCLYDVPEEVFADVSDSASGDAEEVVDLEGGPGGGGGHGGPVTTITKTAVMTCVIGSGYQVGQSFKVTYTVTGKKCK
jgi:hypothetical protein